MKKLPMIFLGLIFILAVHFAISRYFVYGKKQVTNNTPMPRDSQGNIIDPNQKNNSEEAHTFTNKKYMYQISNLRNVDIKTDDTQNYANDAFSDFCLHVYVIPPHLVSKNLDKQILFPLSSIKQLLSLPIDSKKEVLTGEKVENIAIIHTYTRLENSYLGNEKAYVFAMSNNWEMMAATKIFYTQKNNFHYVVTANYGGICEDTDSLDMVQNFQFLNPEI